MRVVARSLLPLVNDGCAPCHLIDKRTSCFTFESEPKQKPNCMILKPPSADKGQAGLEEFRQQAKLHELSLTNWGSRNFYRANLTRWQKLYATLAAKREPDSAAANHYAALSALCGELLDEYGPEQPPKSRPPKDFDAVPLVYPQFPDDVTHRLHFLEGPGARRQRAIELTSRAAYHSKQTSGTDRVLLSVGTRPQDVRLFERLVETIGDGLFGEPVKSGFVADREGGAWPSKPG